MTVKIQTRPFTTDEYQIVEQLKPEQTLSPAALPDFTIGVAEVLGPNE